MLDESICTFRGVGWKILLANNVNPDQTPHYVAPDLGLHRLPMTLLWVSRQEWVKGRVVDKAPVKRCCCFFYLFIRIIFYYDIVTDLF